MRIDKTQNSWFVASVVILVIATIAYIPYVLNSPEGPRGGSAMGLLYGIVGYGMMLFVGLLGVRKKLPIMRLGRATTWMRGHLWLGVISLPIILFHAGFAYRGPLTKAMMILFYIVVISGVFGAALQHYLPRIMTDRVPMETIYEEIPHVRQQLRDEGEKYIVALAGTEDASTAEPISRPDDAIGVATLVEVEKENRQRIREIYNAKIKPYLDAPDATDAQMADPRHAQEVFATIRSLTPASLHGIVEHLETVCHEERQLSRQSRYYQWLHSWQLVHVPLSVALLVMGGLHAILALRY
jgi:hypothetical protein